MDFMATNLVTLVIVATFWIQASSIRIELNQKTAVKMENQLTISCIVDETPDTMIKPIVMNLARTGEENPIAAIEKRSMISLAYGLKSNYQVEGHFGTQDNKLNFLRLTITNASMDDTGEYNCIIFFIDVTGKMKTDSARANLTVDNLDLRQIVHYLMDKMSTQQEVVSGLKDQNEKLEKQVDVQNKKLMEQSSKDKLTTAFSAAYDPQDRFKLRDVVLFRKVSLNLGNAYNQTTGVFTAPREGIYVFQLMAMYESLFNFYIDIKANGKTVARIYAKSKEDWSQSSGHAVVRLSTGDTVKPVVYYLNGSNGPFYIDPPPSVFSGYLVTPL